MSTTLNEDSIDDSNAAPASVDLVVVLGSPTHFRVAPVVCDNPNCGKVHGWHGEHTRDLLTFSASVAQSGEREVGKIIEFATELSARVNGA